MPADLVAASSFLLDVAGNMGTFAGSVRIDVYAGGSEDRANVRRAK